MTKVNWDAYGDHYTAMDRDLDGRLSKPQKGCCPICDRRLPCPKCPPPKSA